MSSPMQVVKLKAFSKFEDTIEALAAATAIGDSKLSKGRHFFSSACQINGQSNCE